MDTVVSHIGRLFMITAGSFLLAVAFNTYMLPHEIIAGGITGFAMLVQKLTSFPAGVQYILYNIPLFLLGWRHLGALYLAYSIVGTLLVSVFLDTIPVFPQIFTRDILLGSIFGGAVAAVGSGIVIRSGGSSGGLDIVGALIQKYLNIPIGTVGMAINAIIILLSIAYYDVTQAMYTLISMVVFMQVLNVVLTSTAKKTLIIISAESEKIAGEIHNKMRRGATFLHGEGSYSHSPVRVLICVVTRYELFKIQELIYDIDPHAFVTITDTQDVRGSFRKQSPFDSSLGKK